MCVSIRGSSTECLGEWTTSRHAIEQARTLRELYRMVERYDRAVAEGKTDNMHARCPHCHRLISLTLIDGLIQVTDRRGVDGD
jgi:hypothetical protein